MPHVLLLPEVTDQLMAKSSTSNSIPPRSRGPTTGPDLGAPVNTTITDHIIIPSGKSTPTRVTTYHHYFTYRGTHPAYSSPDITQP